MRKTLIRLTEEDLHNIITETINRVINDTQYMSDKGLNSIEKAFTPIPGQTFIDKGVRVIQGMIDPNKRYTVSYYNWKGNNRFVDAVIEYPNGKRYTLMKA